MKVIMGNMCLQVPACLHDQEYGDESMGPYKRQAQRITRQRYPVIHTAVPDSHAVVAQLRQGSTRQPNIPLPSSDVDTTFASSHRQLFFWIFGFLFLRSPCSVFTPPFLAHNNDTSITHQQKPHEVKHRRSTD